MKQIYDFEKYSPPFVNEEMLKAEQKRRALRIETALLVFAGILIQFFIVLLGYSAIDWYPQLTALCFFYVVLSTTGGGVIAIIYSRKGDPVL